jgi:predicted metal-dependent phosphoesterase TrpH
LKDATPDELRDMLPDLIPHGLVAIETMHSSYSDETIAISKEIAHDFGLLESGGSDFHGFVKPGVSLGVGRGNLSIGEEYYRALLERK